MKIIRTTALLVSASILPFAGLNAHAQWQQIDGQFKELSVDDQYVWAITTDLEIKRRPIDGSGAWETNKIIGTVENASISGDGWAWSLENGNIWACKKPCSPGRWSQIRGWPTPDDLPAQISGGKNFVWARSDKGMVFRRPINGAAAGTWEPVKGQIRQFSASSANWLYGTHTGSVNKCEKPCRGSWTYVSLSPSTSDPLTEISASNTHVFSLSAGGNIWYRPINEVGETWTAIPGNLKKISASPSGHVWGISAQGNIFRSTLGLVTESKPAVQVAVGTATIGPQAPVSAPTSVASIPQKNTSGCPDGQSVVELEGNLVCQGTIKLSGDDTPIEAFEVKDSDPKSVQYFADLAADRCADPGNLMLDGWNGAERPILEAAGRKFVEKKGWNGAASNMNIVINKLKSDPKLRWEFAPLMIENAWEALVAKSPSAAQSAFTSRFEKWAACDKNLTARRALANWNLHIGKWGTSNSLGNGVNVVWLDPSPEYDTALWSMANKKGPSIYGFDVTNDGNSLYIGSKGRVALGSLIAPLQAAYTPGFNDIADIQYIREDFSGATAAISAGASALFGAGLGVSVSAIPVSHELFKLKFDKKANKALRAKELEKLKRATGKSLQKTKPAVKAAAKSGKKAAQAAAKASRDLLRKAIQNAFSKASTKAGTKAGTKAAQKIGTKVAVQGGSKVGGAVVGVAAMVVIAAATFGEELAEIIQTKLFEEALTNDARNVSPYDVNAAFGPNPGELEKMAVFSLLMKMTIAEPADRNTLSLELPTFDCPIGYTFSNRSCTVDVGFHSQAGLSLSEAKQVATRNGWRLATPLEVNISWASKTLDVYALGIMSDGKFAVPVQKDYSNFKTGTNIGATGGNQGFFYVHDFVNNETAGGGGTFIQNAKSIDSFFPGTDKNNFQQMDKLAASWKIVEHNDYVRIQNAKSPNTFAYVQNGKLEFGPISSASPMGHWKLDSIDGLLFRIESVGLPNRYIHNENGNVELGYTEPNWKGALWSLPGFPVASTNNVTRSTINVTSATYGGNCKAPSGNVTAHIANQCNGKDVCDYSIHYTRIGDPVPGCAKDYIVNYSCSNGSKRNANAPAEAGIGSVVKLNCSQ